MSVKNPAAVSLARSLAMHFANEAPFSDRADEEFDSDDAASNVADAMHPEFREEEESLLAELRPVLGEDLSRKLSDFLGAHEAHHQDGGYLLGLAVGQLIRIPALAPRSAGAK